MTDGQNEIPEKVPDWLKPDLSATRPNLNDRIRNWLLRPPAPSKTAWLLFLMGAMFLGIWLYQRVEYAIERSLPFPFYFGNAGSLAAPLYFICYYGAELLPRQSRHLAAAMRILGFGAGIILLVYGAFALWTKRFP